MINLDINTVISLITAIATVGTIIVALWQLKRTLASREKDQRVSLYHKLRNEAYHIDAWVVADLNTEYRPRCIIIQNGSSGAIRDVSMEALWPPKKQKDVDTDMSTDVPGTAKPWRVLPQGIWLVKESEDPKYQWKFPEPISEEEINGYPPQFSESTRKEVLSISFTDPYNNQWKRTLSSKGEESESIRLLYSEDSGLQSFVV